jgi:hypothetical protein
MPSQARSRLSKMISEVLSGRPVELLDIDWAGYMPPSPYRGVSCVYFVHLLDPRKTSGALDVQRFMGTDPEGILEIGKRTDLADKLVHFRCAVLDSSRSDPEGWKLGFAFSKNKWMQEVFGSRQKLLDSIRFSVIRMDKRRLRAQESKGIDFYLGRFGEPPVLNGQVPGVKGRTAGRRLKTGTVRPKSKVIRSSLVETVDLSAPLPNPLVGVSGVYWVHLMDPEDPTKFFPINRFAHTDPEGILSIGKATNLAHKISNIRYQILNNKGHGEWGLFCHMFDLCELMEELHGPREQILRHLKMSFVRTTRSQLDQVEAQQTYRYMGYFAELPPMCGQMPGNPRLK